MSEFIEFRDVRKVYKMGEVEIPALDGVSFQIKKGEFVVIAGASGAGKSTILNILGGMDTCTSGEILVDGEEVSKMDARQLTTYRRYDIGFVFQFYNLVQNLTARENVELAVQICGKIKGRVTVAADAPEPEVLAAAREAVAAALEGKTVKKEVYVPGRLVNIVAV